MENKKNNFLVIFLLLIIIGLIGFIVYDKGMLVKQTTVEEQEKDTERQFNTEVAEEILDKFNINSDTVEKYSSNEVVKIRAVINNLKENYNMYYSC